jgi:hypothetical protein
MRLVSKRREEKRREEKRRGRGSQRVREERKGLAGGTSQKGSSIVFGPGLP